MEILQLIIKQKYFDEILSGAKTQEFREIRPNTQKKYCELDEEGYCKEVDGILVPRKYDAIRFYVGYNKDRASALVEVKDARIELFEDENHDLIEYEYNGETYLAAQVVYDLGRVILSQKKNNKLNEQLPWRQTGFVYVERWHIGSWRQVCNAPPAVW